MLMNAHSRTTERTTAETWQTLKYRQLILTQIGPSREESLVK